MKLAPFSWELSLVFSSVVDTYSMAWSGDRATPLGWKGRLEMSTRGSPPAGRIQKAGCTCASNVEYNARYWLSDQMTVPSSSVTMSFGLRKLTRPLACEL